MAVTKPQEITDVISELNAGQLESQFLNAIKQIAYNTVNCQSDKNIVPTKHIGKIAIELTFSNEGRSDKVKIEASIKAKIPELNGRGHAVVVKDSEPTIFFADPATGYLSISEGVNTDWNEDGFGSKKVTSINQGK